MHAWPTVGIKVFSFFENIEHYTTGMSFWKDLRLLRNEALWNFLSKRLRFPT